MRFRVNGNKMFNNKPVCYLSYSNRKSVANDYEFCSLILSNIFSQTLLVTTISHFTINVATFLIYWQSKINWSQKYNLSTRVVARSKRSSVRSAANQHWNLLFRYLSSVSSSASILYSIALLKYREILILTKTSWLS